MNNHSHPFLCHLAEIREAESRIATALSKMGKPDTSADLKLAILSHRQDTEGNITWVEIIYNHFCGPDGQDCLESIARQSIENKRSGGLELVSSLKLISEAGPPDNGSQRAWEITCYSCLHEWDGLMDRVDAANFLEAVIEDEGSGPPASDEWN